MAFKIELLADVADVLRATGQVEVSLEDVAAALDDLARDTETSAEDAGRDLEDEYTRALARVTDEAKTAGRQIGDDLEAGTDQATKGLDGLKDSAARNAADAVGSITDVSSALDVVQDSATTALSGLGPGGTAAAAAVTLAVGVIKAGLEDAAARAAAYQEDVQGIAAAMRDASGEAAGLSNAIAESMTDILDPKEWYEVWQKGPVDRLASWAGAVRDLGIEYADVFAAAAGDLEAFQRVQDQAMTVATAEGQSREVYQSTLTFLDALEQQNSAVQDARTWNQAYADSTVEAHRRAAEASNSFSESLTDNLSVADAGLKDFVEDGKLSLAKWSEELKARQAENQIVKDFAITVAPELSQEALENFAKLDTETQAQIAKAFQEGSAADQQTIVENLELEAKIDTIVVSDGVVQDVDDAAVLAQRAADNRPVSLTMEVDPAGLQSQVDRAAASIRPPTIWADIKPRKEVP